jgi:hypothetical protein
VEGDARQLGRPDRSIVGSSKHKLFLCGAKTKVERVENMKGADGGLVGNVSRENVLVLQISKFPSKPLD